MTLPRTLAMLAAKKTGGIMTARQGNARIFFIPEQGATPIDLIPGHYVRQPVQGVSKQTAVV